MSDNAVRMCYLICSALEGSFVMGGGAYLAVDTGNNWWIWGAIIWLLLGSFGFCKRIDSWGVLGKTGE